MISANRVKRLLLYLCKHLTRKQVESMKKDIEDILGFDLEKSDRLRMLRRDREKTMEALASARIN